VTVTRIAAHPIGPAAQVKAESLALLHHYRLPARLDRTVTGLSGTSGSGLLNVVGHRGGGCLDDGSNPADEPRTDSCLCAMSQVGIVQPGPESLAQTTRLTARLRAGRETSTSDANCGGSMIGRPRHRTHRELGSCMPNNKITAAVRPRLCPTQ